jgi:hypothetical protein
MRLLRVAVLGVAAVIGGGTAPDAAAGETWRIKVDAGDVDRSGLPLRAPIALPAAEVARGPAVRLTGPAGLEAVGQIVPWSILAAEATASEDGAAAGAATPCDILFVLPRLAAGTSVELSAELAAAGTGAADAAPRLVWREAAGGADLLCSGRPLLRAETPVYDASSDGARVRSYKPFHHVFDPETGTLLTKGDGGGYTHHRGIFFGYNKITHGPESKLASDCWHCTGKSRQEHRAVLLRRAGAVAAIDRAAIDWIGGDGAKLLGETREIDVVPVTGGTVIDFASRLVADAPVRLDGDPQHAGVHFRAANEVHEKTKGETYYLRPGVKAPPGGTRNWPADKTWVNAPWHAASFVVGGRRHTVLRANRPENPGEARMSERDYGRFGSYFEYELSPESPLLVGYRFWVQPGEMTLEEAARIAADYARPARVTTVR